MILNKNEFKKKGSCIDDKWCYARGFMHTCMEGTLFKWSLGKL